MRTSETSEAIREYRDWIAQMHRALASVDQVLSELEYGYEMTSDDCDVLRQAAETMHLSYDEFPTEAEEFVEQEIARQAAAATRGDILSFLDGDEDEPDGPDNIDAPAAENGPQKPS